MAWDPSFIGGAPLQEFAQNFAQELRRQDQRRAGTQLAQRQQRTVVGIEDLPPRSQPAPIILQQPAQQQSQPWGVLVFVGALGGVALGLAIALLATRPKS
jgi:hypothetical protein